MTTNDDRGVPVTQQSTESGSVDVYRVGFLRDLHHARVPGQRRSRWRWFCRSWRRRSYWNGWLAEHEGHPHNAGRGWTRRAARRRADRLCLKVSS